MKKQLQNNCSSELFINGSKFFAYGFNIKTIKEAKDIIEKIRKENLKAVHVCYAYVLNENKQIYEKADDDGEPKNSAGKKILSALKDNLFCNSLIVVVRYKSKSLLGVGLLSRSYLNVSLELVSNPQNYFEYKKMKTKIISFIDYKQLNQIIYCLQKSNYSKYEINENNMTISVDLDEQDFDKF